MLCGTNMADVKISNRSAVLRLLHESGGMSRKQIAARLKLTPASITVIINDLIQEAILGEGTTVPNTGTAGRREILVDISRSKYIALGFALRKEEVRLTVTNLCGDLVYEDAALLPETTTPQYFVDTAFRLYSMMMASRQYCTDAIVGAGVTICGVVDCANGIILDSDGIWEERDVPIEKMLRRLFPFPVFVANNVRSYANAYSFLLCDQALKNMLFIRNEANMGAALILDNQFYDGDRNRSAAIAHVTVEPDGRPCHCGKRGCLDTVASMQGMMNSLRECFSPEHTPFLFEFCAGDFSKVTFSLFMKAVSAGDPGACTVMENALRQFATVLAFSIQLLDVQRIVFYGEMFENRLYFSRLRQLLSEKCPDNIRGNVYDVVPSDMKLERKAAPILAVSVFFNAGGYKTKTA